MPMLFMTSSSTSLLQSSPSTGRRLAALNFPASTAPRYFTTSSGWPLWKKVTFSPLLQCNAVSRPRTKECVDVFSNGLPVIKWPEIVEDDIEKDGLSKVLCNISIAGKVISFSNRSWLTLANDEPKPDKVTNLVQSIRSMLYAMDDGEITISAYDTAWVAMVDDIGGSGAPQFPSSLEWIAKNQFPDGSWGDKLFSAHDRIINTLACVVALTSWNMHHDKSEKGLSFVKENLCKLDNENAEHMPIGFEVAFPSLMELAKNLGIDISNDSPVLEEIYARRDLKLTRIPKEIMHNVPTTLLHSLEGMQGLEWRKLLKLQCEDGSFLFSPSSTAFALQQTKDANCLKYLAKAVHKFNGGVPNVYPVDLFEHLWAVDRLQRLGISRYFEKEVAECVDYVHRYWTDKGICWARNSKVHDIDDTSMGFRLLRLHGYEISADVFKHFEKDGEFFCFAGQSNQAVTGMYNMYRASELMFPGENILADAKTFSTKFLQEKRANNELLDKWVITKDLPGEVGYALDMPWYASLPRVETRFYLEQYGGDKDVWIGKTLYRMAYVNNNTYLELAKLDYNNCQALHQLEWNTIQKWYQNCNFREFRVSERSLLVAYYMAAASIFEPERLQERLAWTKTTILVETIASIFNGSQFSRDDRSTFLDEFLRSNSRKYANAVRHNAIHSVIRALVGTLKQLSLDTLLAHGGNIHAQLHFAWEKWLTTWEEGDDEKGEGEIELLLRTLNLIGGSMPPTMVLSHPRYQQLVKVTTKVYHQLRLLQHRKVHNTNSCVTHDMGGNKTMEIESDMQELVKLVLSKSSDDLNSKTKQMFFTVARSFYYAAYCNPETISFHISKVLFERVL